MRRMRRAATADCEQRPHRHGLWQSLRVGSMFAACSIGLAGCVGSEMLSGTNDDTRPVTVRENVVYESPSTELRRVEDSEGRVIRYERRSKPR